MIEQLNSFIDSLSLDHKRGASEIVHDAAELFVEIAREGINNADDAGHIFERAVRRLARGQPTMAPVLNLLNRLCFLFERADGDWQVFLEGVQGACRPPFDFIEEMQHYLDEIPVARTLIAFSNSSTVAQIIIAQKNRNGWPEKVYCGEGRPVMEGVVLAKKLTAAGLDVTLFTDAALMSRVEEADAVWVGGDSLSRNGLVNKVGSRALALLCKYLNKPFLSLMASDKLLPTELIPYFYAIPQNPREIGADDADSLKIFNEYYEEIPATLVSGIFTESGIDSPEDVVSQIENEPLSPFFAQLVKR